MKLTVFNCIWRALLSSFSTICVLYFAGKKFVLSHVKMTFTLTDVYIDHLTLQKIMNDHLCEILYCFKRSCSSTIVVGGFLGGRGVCWGVFVFLGGGAQRYWAIIHSQIQVCTM